MNYKARLNRLRRALAVKGAFPYLITDLCNIRYLTGFTGSYAYMLIGEKSALFISDSRYAEYAESILWKSVDFVLQDGDIHRTLKSLLRGREKTVRLEEHSLNMSFYNQLKKTLAGIRLVLAGDEVNALRMVKDEDEIAILKKVASIADGCFNHMLGFIRHGMTEWDISNEIEFYYRRNGCRKSSFPAIVASGPGSSMPHYETSMNKKIRNGDVILIDMGCEYSGYNSDLTRTIFAGRIDAELEKIYGIVREANIKGTASARAGISTGRLDESARSLIADAGYGKYFGHSLGHGLGLEVHELPAVKKGGELKLKKNMVVTIEPGIYIPGKGGVRIEDMVVVNERGCEILTGSPKDLIII